jgi:BCD family chlorophyll transporter-like MFS transporter
MAVAAVGAAVGVPAFLLVLTSAVAGSVALLIGSTLLAGFGAGLFGHGTLTATMRSAPRDQIGLSLGAWGAVQTTAAGVAIAIGGVIRDVMLLAPGAEADGAAPYVPVFALEAGLLALALVVAWPLWRGRLDSRQESTTLDNRPNARGPETLVTPKA